MDSLLIFVLLFKSADSACELFALNERKNISFNQLLTTFNVFPIEYEILFKVCLATFFTGKNEQLNLFEFTTADSMSYGLNSGRVIGIWFGVNGIMYIYANINGAVIEHYTTKAFTTGCKLFKISQLLYQRFYYFTTNVDGVNVYTTKNTGVKEFNNVKMYFSDPWYTSQPGYFQNLLVTKRCSESNFYCTPQLNVLLNWNIIMNILAINFQVSYNFSGESAFNVSWEYFLPRFVLFQSEIVTTNTSKIIANSLKYSIPKLLNSGVNHTITASIKNTECLFGDSYNIDIPVKLYFENCDGRSWQSFRTIRDVSKENCKRSIVPNDPNRAPEYYGRGIYWDDASAQIYLCMNRYVLNIQKPACFFSKDNGAKWQDLDVSIGAVLGHHILSRELYAIHRNHKLYLMFHNSLKEWLAVTNDEFNFSISNKLNWTQLKTFDNGYDGILTLGDNQWMGNRSALYFKKLNSRTWMQRFKWNE